MKRMGVGLVKISVKIYSNVKRPECFLWKGIQNVGKDFMVGWYTHFYMMSLKVMRFYSFSLPWHSHE
jgi:hypothetical protein